MSELNMEGKKSQNVTQYIARQPIFNADRSVYAYELLYRESSDNVFPIEPVMAKPPDDSFLMH